jgi:NAD(P)-dependent dehydrogenase (short-subunit alcohol dehydrogenase family)
MSAQIEAKGQGASKMDTRASANEKLSFPSNWTATDIPSVTGRSAVVTGTGGLGFEDALELAGKGAEVVIAGRNDEKGQEAVRRIRATYPKCIVRFEKLDLASLASVKEFGKRMRDERQSLNLLINNAAVMAPPKRSTSSDGFELQFGTNYLGHFALTSELLPLLAKASDARVINVCSIADRSAKIDFDDLQSERRYNPMAVYGQSKLANLIFSLELQRQSDSQGWGLKSIAAHPGLVGTELINNGPGGRSPLAIAKRILGSLLFQTPARGAVCRHLAASGRGILLWTDRIRRD